MKGKDQERICSHCEGRITVAADTCLYCGMPLVEERSSSEESLYAPLYSTKNSFSGKEFKEAPKAQPQSFGEISLPEQKEEEKSGFLAMVLSLLGSTLFILGIMQGFFSEEGVLRLEWKSDYWFILCLIALPLFYFGFKKASGPVTEKA
jgi:hypothetical protein